MTESLLTVREVAAALRVSMRQVWKLASADRLPKPVRLGRSVRWRRTDIERYIELGCDQERFAAGAITPSQAVNHV